MTPQQLKNSILQMAMQGKLVEQRPKEGTGEELYQQIQKEKQKLIKKGKIKKEKPMPEITEGEIPFEIPESWKWTYIGEIFQHNTGKALNGVSGPGTMLPYITTSNLYWDRFELDRLKEMPFTEAEVEKCTVCKGDLLVCEGGDFGRAAIWTKEEPMRIQNHIHRLRPYSDINIRFFYYIFYFYKNAGMISGKGIGIQGLSSNALHKLIIPLPPRIEQDRIVEKIEELSPYLNKYDEAYDDLQSYNTRFPDDLKKSILQQAVQGKLVPQNPNDEPASELLKKIAKEKEKLVREGKIKKQKPLPPITDEEIPFDIPESWEWVHIGDVFQHNTGKALNGASGPGKILTYITTSNLYWNKFELDKLKKMPFTKAEIEKCTVQKNDLLVCEGGDFGRAAIWVKDEPMRIQNHIHRLRAFYAVDIKFYYYIFLFYKNADLISGKGIGIKGLSSNVLHKLVIPLPPLAEQKRIVTKLDELLPQIDRLREHRK